MKISAEKKMLWFSSGSQSIYSHDFKMKGRIIGPGMRCLCGAWKYPIVWHNGKTKWICVRDMLETSWGSWVVNKEALNLKERVHNEKDLRSLPSGVNVNDFCKHSESIDPDV